MTNNEDVKVIRGLDYWAKHADNPAIRVDCAAGRDALEAAQQAPAVDREALLEWERKSFAASNGTQVWVEFQGGIGSITDDLIASGILQDADELRAEALEALLESVTEPGLVQVFGGEKFVSVALLVSEVRAAIREGRA